MISELHLAYLVTPVQGDLLSLMGDDAHQWRLLADTFMGEEGNVARLQPTSKRPKHAAS